MFSYASISPKFSSYGMWSYNNTSNTSPNSYGFHKIQEQIFAGSNITIGSDGRTINATNTTYSPFNGATAQLDGSAGLVPQPLIADKDKYLKGDGTWATVQAGPTVVQTTGQSTTDVMSQKAVTDIIGDIESALQILNSGAGVP
jgi:hypothetical protein